MEVTIGNLSVSVCVFTQKEGTDTQLRLREGKESQSKGPQQTVECSAAAVVSIKLLSTWVHCRYFQHAHFIPIVGVGKRGEF